MSSEAMFRSVIDCQTAHAVVCMDRTGRILLWNPGAEKLFQYRPGQIVGRLSDALFPLDLEAAAQAMRDELEEAERLGAKDVCQWLRREDGTMFWADGTIYRLPATAGETRGYVKVVRDATERKRAEEEVSKLALADSLTGLPNRAGFKQRLQEAILQADRNGRLFFVLLMDLDHFKHINDVLGHLGGDELLRQVARRTRDVVRDADVVTRLGGDEFGLLITDSDDQRLGGVIAEKIIAALSALFQIGDHQVTVGASIGISVYPHDGTDVLKLTRKADEALYKAKSEGRNNYQYFTAFLNHRAHHRTHELAQMAKVLPRHISLLYQPIVDGHEHVVAVEALLRCSYPYFSGYPVDTVVALASETGRLREIGIRSVSEACQQVGRWQRDGWPELHLAMNFYRMEIGGTDLVRRIVRTVDKADFPLVCFEADLSERQLRGGNQDDHALRDIQSSGITLTIDDFNGDQASLVRLASMASKIKIDLKAFPLVPLDAHSNAVLVAIVQLAHALGLQVIIERVQSRDQAEFVRGQCDGMQGYYYAPPMTAVDAANWLATRRSGLVA